MLLVETVHPAEALADELAAAAAAAVTAEPVLPTPPQVQVPAPLSQSPFQQRISDRVLVETVDRMEAFLDEVAAVIAERERELELLFDTSAPEPESEPEPELVDEPEFEFEFESESAASVADVGVVDRSESVASVASAADGGAGSSASASVACTGRRRTRRCALDDLLSFVDSEGRPYGSCHVEVQGRRVRRSMRLARRG